MDKYLRNIILLLILSRRVLLFFPILMLLANSLPFDSRQGEFLVDTGFVYIPACRSQRDPAISFDGTNYFVAWTDCREEIALYGTRVNQEGKMLDSAGIIIAYKNGGSDGDIIGMAFDSSNYLVVWRRWPSGGGGADLYGTRVTRDGVVLDITGIPICQSHHVMDVCVVYGGLNYLVVWSDWYTGSVYCARVTPDGTVLDTAGLFIGNSSEFPSAVFDGMNYYVAFVKNEYSETNIYGARVSQSGTVLDPGGLPVCLAGGEQYMPSVAFDGTNYFVEWQDYRSGSYSDIYGARVNRLGIVIDTNGIVVSAASDDQDRSSIAFDGINYMVTWSDYRNGLSFGSDIYGARVTTTGTVLDTTGILIHADSQYEWSPKVAFGSIGYLAVWEGEDYGAFNVHGARIDTTGVVVDTSGIIISTAAEFQHASGVAFDGSNYLAIWKQQSTDPSIYGIYGMRISSSGNPIDSAGIYINSTTSWAKQPAVAAGDSTFLVTWEEYASSYGEVLFTRVSKTGAVLDTGIMLSNSGFRSAVAFDGANYLVVWSDCRNSMSHDIYGARIDESGAVIDTNGFIISNAYSTQYYPYAAFNGNHYLVAWKDCRHGRWDIYGARVSTSGTVLDTAGIAICTTSYNKDYPAVASDGNNFLVIWYQETYMDQVWGARVSPDGSILDSAGIFIAEGLDASIMYYGQQYVIPYIIRGYGSSLDVYVQILNQDGSLGDNFDVCTETGQQFAPFAVAGAGDSLLFIYSGWTDSINSHPAYSYRVWGKVYPFTSVAEQTAKAVGLSAISLKVSPNPFTRMTNIVCLGPDSWRSGNNAQQMEPLERSLKIYDITGRLVKNIGVSSSTTFNATWNGTDEQGRAVPGGVYFIGLKNGESIITKKIVLIR